jgi:hypothetical protein
MDRILERQLAKKRYVEVETLLRDIMPVVKSIMQTPARVEHPTREDKAPLEKHHAGCTAFMIKHAGGNRYRVSVCMEEVQDCDCIFKGEYEGNTFYRLVQLKQVPSHNLDATISVQRILDDLKRKYPRSPDLIVSIWVNRDCPLALRDLDFEGLGVEQLYLYGDDGKSIFLHGGPVSLLNKGICLECRMTGGITTPRFIRFKQD